MKYRYSFLLFLAFLFLSFLFAAVGDLAQKGTRKRARLALVLVLVLVLAALLGGGGGNRGRAVCGGLVAGALRLGCGLAPLPGPRCFVLSANGKRPRRRSPSATLPALVWAAALIGRAGCGPWVRPWPVPVPVHLGRALWPCALA